jgi:hypothetical protein
MDKFERFLRNLAKGEGKSKRAKRRLMDRELTKLNNANDRSSSNRVDAGGDD